MKNSRIIKWTEDIDQLALELPQHHKNLFYSLSEKDFYRQIEELKRNLEHYDNQMVIVNIAAIVASVRDSHTTVNLSITRVIPFEFYWFPQGIYIIGSLLKYADALNCKVTHINGIPIEEVIHRVEGIVSHENNSFLKAQLPKYLPAVEVLYGLEIIDEFNKLELMLERLNGEVLKLDVDTHDYKEFMKEMIKKSSVSEDCLPLYRRNKEKYFWSHFIKEQSILYFNYNKCKDMEHISVEKFCLELLDFINRGDVERLVIDLRNNLGGNSTLLEPFIVELAKYKKLNNEGGIYVILGRETFSSALLNVYFLKNNTNAMFVGEATGGKPNCYGEVQYFDLKNSKLKIRYSTEYYKIIKDDKQQSLFPEINIEVSIQDYLDNRDPCMDFILNIT